MSPTPEISVVVPLLNEEKNVRPLVRDVREALAEHDDWELVLVDDGSTDETRDRICILAEEDSRIVLVPLARNYGQATAMQAGFDHARADIVVTMDGDLQNDPRDIPRLVEKLREGYDLVAGYRERRKDDLLTRKVPSWCANRLIRLLTRVPIRDNGCSLKAYRRDLLRRVRLYSDMHRFIPALAAGTAGARIAEIPVRHHPRRWGSSKYGLSRVVTVSLDLLAVVMIRSFRSEPLVLFALMGAVAVALGVGGALAAVLAVVALPPGSSIPLVLPGSALLLWALAAYLLMLGLIGEVVVREHRRRSGGSPILLQEEGA